MMDTSLILLIIVMVAGFFAGTIFLLTRQITNLKNDLKSDDSTVLTEWLKDMKTSVDKNSETIERQLQNQRVSFETQMRGQQESLTKQTKMIWERLQHSQNVIGEVQKQLGGLQEFGSDMKDLSNVLKSPKLRGGLGEQFLYEILENSLPKELFKTQYKFKGGDVCDAIVYTDKGIIPIDSKFPMENFKLMLSKDSPEERERAKKVFVRDVKKRIEEISGKYILPEEGTTDFAVMYIPSENVYYELIVNTQEIEDYARAKNVFMTSPNTLNYQMKAILVAYQQTELQKHAGEILKSLAGIKVEAEKFEEELGVLDRHITNAYKSVDGVKGRFGKLFNKIDSVQTVEEAPQPKLID